MGCMSGPDVLSEDGGLGKGAVRKIFTKSIFDKLKLEFYNTLYVCGGY